MNLEDQVCSLELAKRLKELGIKQNSYFVWFKDKEDEEWPNSLTDAWQIDDDERFDTLSAFTVADLGQMLPKSISIMTEDEDKKIFSNFRLVAGRNLIFKEDKFIEHWVINYICDSTNEFRNWLFDPLLMKSIYDDNEANARAKMLIYLIENKLMEVPISS